MILIHIKFVPINAENLEWDTFCHEAYIISRNFVLKENEAYGICLYLSPPLSIQQIITFFIKFNYNFAHRPFFG